MAACSLIRAAARAVRLALSGGEGAREVGRCRALWDGVGRCETVAGNARRCRASPGIRHQLVAFHLAVASLAAAAVADRGPGPIALTE